MSHCLPQRKAHPVRPISREPPTVRMHNPPHFFSSICKRRVFATGGRIHCVRHVDGLLVLGLTVTVRRRWQTVRRFVDRAIPKDGARGTGTFGP